MNNKYIGHPSQIFDVRESRLTGGKADGMRVLEVRNGKGLEFTVSLDRCADIPYLFYKGNSMAYIAPCGMVGPHYYDNSGINFLKSFTAGFLTTLLFKSICILCCPEIANSSSQKPVSLLPFISNIL